MIFIEIEPKRYVLGYKSSKVIKITWYIFYIFCEVVVPKGNKVIRTKLIKYLYQVIFVLLSVTKTNLLT